MLVDISRRPIKELPPPIIEAVPRLVHHDDTWSMTRDDKNYLMGQPIEIFRDSVFFKFFVADSSINEIRLNCLN